MSVEYKVALRIEQDETVPVPLVQVALQEEGDQALITVVATNWAASDTGAQAVASLLRETAEAIDRELGAAPKRPRFNPQPRKPGGGR